MTQQKSKIVDNYIQKHPKENQKILSEMRAIIQSVLPDAAEEIKWGHPAYSYETMMVSFAAHKHNINLYTSAPSIRALASDLKEYKTGQMSIQFPYDKPLPKGLIKKVVAYRLKEFREQGIRWM